jgi:hypothetical protein
MRPPAQRVMIPILAPTPPTLPPPRKATPTRLLLAGGGAILAAAACCLVVIVLSGSASGEVQRQPDVVTRPDVKDAPVVLPARPAAEPGAPSLVAEKIAPRDTAPSMPLRPDLESRVASDAAEELRRVWASVAEGCPAGNGDAGDGTASSLPEFIVTFDAEGDEIGRSPSGNRGQQPGLGACFLARHDLRLRVPAPGREIQVAIRAPAL